MTSPSHRTGQLSPEGPPDVPTPGEELAFREIADLVVQSVRRDYPPGTIARRDAHAKHHGIVRARFEIGSDVPEALRHGIFATPRTFDAWIRYSNGSPHPQADARRDQRGMAIKLVGVPGPKILDDERDAVTHDFLLASFPRFFIRSVADYVQFTRAATRKPSFRVLGFFLHGWPWQWRFHELRTLFASLEHTDDLFALRYWSQTPYRLGPHVVKYSARPVVGPLPPDKAGRDADYLRETMARRLREQPAVFEFLVQPRTDPATMSIEDSTILWSEADAPFHRVATITIPLQEFSSAAQMAFAENISYTCWHALPEHRPLGAVNRTRRVVYEAVSRARHALNGTVRQEPVSMDLPDVTVRKDMP